MPFTTIDGLNVHYVLDQPEAPGHRVLYVHGTGCNVRVWARHIAAVSERHACAALDLPGHGGSEGRGFRGAADYAHFVHALADHLGWDRFVLAGHSLGGAVALVEAAYHPARLAGLILIDTGARLRVDPVVLDAARRAAAGETVPPGDPRWAFTPRTPDAVLAAVGTDLGTVDPEVVHRDWIADDTFDFMSRVRRIDVPALAVCGSQDRLTPVRNHVYLHTAMPDCALAVIEACGHWPTYEQPGQFDEIVLDFLAQLPAR